MAKARYIKSTEPGSRVLHWSKYLADRDDMIECTLEGIPLNAVGQVAASAGISMRPSANEVIDLAEKSFKNLSEALGIPLDQVVKMARSGKVEPGMVGDVKDPIDDPVTLDSQTGMYAGHPGHMTPFDELKDMTIEQAREMPRGELVGKIKAVFGDKADHIKGNASYDDIFKDLGLLIAASELD